MKALLALGLLLLPALALAHEVHANPTSGTAHVITLTYADGKPFAFEQFEVAIEGSEIPQQVGRTDAQGRAAVLPVAGKPLLLTAVSKDGHGTKLTLAPLAADTAASTSSEAQLSRPVLVAAGAGVLFGLFGLIQLFTRRKEHRP